jgi:hypothetical protein
MCNAELLFVVILCVCVFGEFEVMVLMLIYYLYFVGGACLLLFALMVLATDHMLSYSTVYFVFF